MHIESDQKIYTPSEDFLRVSLQHKEPYPVTVGDVTLEIHPQTLSPKYAYSAIFFINNWDIQPGHRVLDIGTGCGILAIFASRAGASKVVALDMNPYAVETARKNSETIKGCEKIQVIQSDGLEKLAEQKFDRILFAAPYFNQKADPNIPLTFAIFDENYKSARKILSAVKDYLADDGLIQMSFSNELGDEELMESVIADAGLDIQSKIGKKRGHSRTLYSLVPR